MTKISAVDKRQFDRDGFLVVDQLNLPVQIPGCVPSLTRQICNGWKANREIARVVLDESIAQSIAELSGWPGVRIVIDNDIWKPVGARSLGYHQDSSYLDWFLPSDLLTCWMAPHA